MGSPFQSQSYKNFLHATHLILWVRISSAHRAPQNVNEMADVKALGVIIVFV